MSADPVLPLTLAAPQEQPRYGAARLVRNHNGRAYWHIACKPHVMIALKRMFPQIRTAVTEVVILTHTRTVATDLTWFMFRYPLDLFPDDEAFLTAETAAQAATETRVRDILSGAVREDDGTFRTMSAQTLRDYQQVAADVVTVNKRTLIGDEIGLGKTLTGLATFRNPGSLPAAIIVQTQLTRQWEAYCNAVWPSLRTHIAKIGRPSYDIEKAAGGPVDVFILPYSKVAGWSDFLAGRVRTVILDEVQDLRTGAGTEKGRGAKRICAEAEFVVPMTNTPVYNYGDEIHNILNIVAPGALGSRDEFLREWGQREWTTQSGARHATVANPKALGLYLRERGLLLARTRKEVGRELTYGTPERIPQIVPSDTKVLERLTGDAVEMARLILSKDSTREARFTASGEFDMLMRQATGLAKAPYVAAFVAALLEAETVKRVVMWGWHHAVYDVWQERLKAAGVRSVRYTGQESPTAKAKALARFTRDPAAYGFSREDVAKWEREEQSGAQVLIMSLRSGAGVDGLQKHCHTGVFGELDWSPQVMYQCLGRLDRDGQQDPVTGYYLLSEEGSDPVIAEKLNLKLSQSAPMMDPSIDNVMALPTEGGSKIKDLARELLRQRGMAIPD